MPTLVEEAAEAICGALHRFEFRFLGETPGAPGDSGVTTWWTRGRKPDVVRVAVLRCAPWVRVNVEFPHMTSGVMLKGEKVFTVNAAPYVVRTEIEDATKKVVEGVLSIYHDVLGGTGVAAPQAVAHRPNLPNRSENPFGGF